MGTTQEYTMPVELTKIIKPMPAGLIRLITLKQLNTQAYWVRPVITGARPGVCPCCGAVHPMAAHGVCGGCYEPAIKKGLFGPALLDHLAHRAKCGKKIRPSGPKAISGEKVYAMAPALASVLRPMSQAEAETATLAGLMKFWRRPLIKHSQVSACPCCGKQRALKCRGLCSGCNSDKVAKNNLTGLALLHHLSRRANHGHTALVEWPGQILSQFIEAECTLSPPRSVLVATLYSAFCLWHEDNLDKGPRPSLKAFDHMIMGGEQSELSRESWPVKKEQREGKYHYSGISLKCDLKESISPAPESPSPAATPLAGAGQVECKEQQAAGLEGVAVAVAIRIALGLDIKTSVRDLPALVGKLVADVKHHKEQHLMLDESYCKVSIALGAAENEQLPTIATLRMKELATTNAKVAELTQEVASLNRLLAKTPMDGLAEAAEEQGFSWSAAAALMSICTALCLDQQTPLEEIVKHIGSLVEQRDMLEQESRAVAIALCAGEDDNLALIALRAMDEAQKAACLCAPAATEEAIVAKWSGLPVPDGYEALTDVMTDAIHQAAFGKGLERHADHRPFHEQPIMRETEAVGLGHPAGQARKKILEAVRCCEDHPERAIADLLGAINYTAALVIAIRANRVEQAA